MICRLRAMGFVLLAAVLAPLTGSPLAAAYEPVFEPTECWFALPESQPVECGYLVVPENRADPGSPDIRIAVAILRHADGHPEPDPILRLHGGPGGGYLRFMEVAWQDDAALFAANRDVIAFDQRGQGMSEPSLDCPEVAEAYFDLVDYQLDGKRLTGDEFQEHLAAAFGECYARLSPDHDLSAYDTAANAADAADLMQALGYDSYNVHAGSYGTIVAQALMRDHPEGIRSVILDAPGNTNETVDGQVPAMRHALDQVFDSCAADAVCNAAFPDLRQSWLDTLARLDADPPLIEAVDDFQGRTFGVLLNGANAAVPLRLMLTNTGAIRTIPLAIANASQGNHDLLAKGWGGFLARAGTYVGWGALASVHCGGMVSISGPEALDPLIAATPELADYYDHGPLDGRLVFRICENWPVERASDAEVAPVQSEIPTLLLVGQIDAATNFEDARAVAEGLAKAYGPYVFPALGHIVGLGSHDCPTAIEVAFLSDPTTDPDTGCIDEMEPVSFVTELTGGGEVNLVAYQSRGFRGLVPDGWNELQPGFFARSDPSVDKTLFVQLAAPAAEAEEMMNGVLGEFGIAALPDEPLKRLPAGGMTWELYLPGSVVPLIVARAETDAVTYVAVLVAGKGELDGLADSVLIPAISALTPAE